jgi:hypothetical protein
LNSLKKRHDTQVSTPNRSGVSPKPKAAATKKVAPVKRLRSLSSVSYEMATIQKSFLRSMANSAGFFFSAGREVGVNDLNVMVTTKQIPLKVTKSVFL